MSDPNVKGVEIPLKHLSVLNLQPGDTLVVRCQMLMSRDAMKAMKELLADQFPGHMVLILDAGIELSIVRPVPPVEYFLPRDGDD